MEVKPRVGMFHVRSHFHCWFQGSQSMDSNFQFYYSAYPWHLFHTKIKMFINVGKSSYPYMRGPLSIEVFRYLNPKFPISSVIILSPRSAFPWQLLHIEIKPRISVLVLKISTNSFLKVAFSNVNADCNHFSQYAVGILLCFPKDSLNLDYGPQPMTPNPQSAVRPS